MYIDEEGARWYQGNLHTHSTRSDGHKTPEQIYELYRSRGYDFIALTDHWRPSVNQMQPNGLLTLAGCEYDIGTDPVKGVFHIVGIGMKQTPALVCHDPAADTQQIIDTIRASGGEAILAHPAWSFNTEAHIRPLHHLCGTEIYNSTSATPWNCRPYSGEVIDQLALRGVYLPCMAADDAHHYNGDECRSFIQIRAEECTPDALLNALRRGDFYATQGPRFSWRIRGSELIVHCSPVQQIVIFDNLLWNGDRTRRGDGLTELHYPIHKDQRFIRLELTDAEGRTAWSSPIPLSGR